MDSSQEVQKYCYLHNNYVDNTVINSLVIPELVIFVLTATEDSDAGYEEPGNTIMKFWVSKVINSNHCPV